MREIHFAERPEHLERFQDLPILALYDLGMRTQGPTRYREIEGQREKVQYREYWTAGIPPIVEETGEPLIRAPQLPGVPVIGTRIGVDYYSDLWEKYPEYMYSDSHFVDIVPVQTRVLEESHKAREVSDTAQAGELGRIALDAILREQPLGSFAFIGNDTILEFLRGYIDESEAEKEKSMPWRSSSDYLLSRADADLVLLITSAYAGGVETTDLPVPEEHRYRALLNAAGVFAWYHTGSRREFDIPRKPLSEFGGDERRQQLEIELSHPLHSVNGMFHRGHYEFLKMPYNPSIAYFLNAYGATEEEFTEIVQQVWYMQTYWFEASQNARSINDHFDRPPNPENAKLFVAQTPRQDIAYYNDIIAATVHAGINPYGQPLDLRH
ncbi:MAG: hypothetical protein H6799_02925 [Candidatus Nomurabacteria bacterium]|nr:MAG: hypothetical protein H6799_02925 [Candidatus Nomurabacteria bacterium]